MGHPMNVRRTLKDMVIGKSRDPRDAALFHKLSLIAFFAWVGLGADGLSSSCYGPPEAFLTLGGHKFLSVFVGLGTVLTIYVISASYSQIVELFPTGGGGYFVASKLLSPWLGMVSGCALLIDYVLTIAVSIASGADAICSFLPPGWSAYKLDLAILIVTGMTVLNMRGVKESVLPIVPVFLIFLATHFFVIVFGIATHAAQLGAVATNVAGDVHRTIGEVGIWGLALLILRSYSMGAGTFTGIEAVSNGIPFLREPRVQTARQTMRYMANSLAFVAMGLMLCYLLYNVDLQNSPGKTLNAVLFERFTSGWGAGGAGLFILVSLISEATLLSVAAQTGFLGGPRVLANMAIDRWLPTKFSMLSDRLIIQNGVFIMGGLSLVIMFITGGSVRLLVVLYSINVFITFTLSQLGMVRHWWQNRRSVATWRAKLSINGLGLVLSLFILVSMVALKFHEGGWVTLLITGTLIVLAMLVRQHYREVGRQLRQLDGMALRMEEQTLERAADHPTDPPAFDPNAKTAVILVSGFNGSGLHVLSAVTRLFGGVFRNFVFLEVGVLDAGNFKGPQEVDHLQGTIRRDVDRYVQFVQCEGYYAESVVDIGVDVVDQVTHIAPTITARYPTAVFFGGQLLFIKESVFSRLLHNQIVFGVQKSLHRMAIPFVILPIRV
jgi:amino acid transporter